MDSSFAQAEPNKKDAGMATPTTSRADADQDANRAAVTNKDIGTTTPHEPLPRQSQTELQHQKHLLLLSPPPQQTSPKTLASPRNDPSSQPPRSPPPSLTPHPRGADMSLADSVKSQLHMADGIQRKRSQLGDPGAQENSGGQVSNEQSSVAQKRKRQRLVGKETQINGQENGHTEEELPPVELHHIGSILGMGRTSQIVEYNVRAEGLALKIFADRDSFNRELLSYQIIRSSTENQTSIPVPHFYGQVPLNKDLSTHTRLFATDREHVPIMPYATALALERLRGPLLMDVLLSLSSDIAVSSSYLETLQKDLQEALQFLHRLGIAHSDIKDNNIMFRDSNTSNCCFIDFGAAEFRSQLSASSWKRNCQSDREDLDDIFYDAQARLAIDLGLRHLKSNKTNPPNIRPSAADPKADTMQLLDTYDRASPTLKELETGFSSDQDTETFQHNLAALLKVVSPIPIASEPLLDAILARFPEPTPLLALPLIDILSRGRSSRKAMQMTNAQLSNESLSLPFRARILEKKIQLLCSGGYGFSPRIKCLDTAISVFEELYGPTNLKTMSARHELAKACEMTKDMKRADEIYRDTVQLLGNNEPGSGDGSVSREDSRGLERLMEKWRGEWKLLQKKLLRTVEVPCVKEENMARVNLPQLRSLLDC